MYPYQRTPMGNPYISPIYPYIVGVYGLLSPRIPIYKPYKYHGYTVRGTPNFPLILGRDKSPFVFLFVAKKIRVIGDLSPGHLK